METSSNCPHCGAQWIDSQTCTDYFHVLGAWELENQLYDLHHLMVLCYYLQHPHLYSPDGLTGAKKMLVNFLEDGISPQTMRKQMRQKVDSKNRDYKITGTLESFGEYDNPIQWEMFVGDVVVAGIENYYASIQHWAKLTLKTLRDSNNLD